MDITCPELATIDETSEYGSRDTSTASQQEEGLAVLCALPEGQGRREETTILYDMGHFDRCLRTSL